MYAFINRILNHFRTPKPPVCWCGAEACKIRSHAKPSKESDQARRNRREAQRRRHAKQPAPAINATVIHGSPLLGVRGTLRGHCDT